MFLMFFHVIMVGSILRLAVVFVLSCVLVSFSLVVLDCAAIPIGQRSAQSEQAKVIHSGIRSRQQDAAISGEAEAAAVSSCDGRRGRLRVRFVLGNCQSGQPGHYRRAKISRTSRAFRGGCGCWELFRSGRSGRSQAQAQGTAHTADQTG